MLYVVNLYVCFVQGGTYYRPCAFCTWINQIIIIIIIIRTIKPARDRVVHVSSQPVDAARDEGPVETRSALRESEGELAEVEETQSLELQRVRELLRQAEAEVEECRTPTQQHDEELHGLRAVVAKEKQKVKRIWREKCEQQLSHKEAIDRKVMEIARLKARLLAVTSPPSPPTSPGSSIRVFQDEPRRPSSSHRRGKAPPPVDSFSAESLYEQWDDCLERAAEWNGWTDSERLLQLADHLRGKTRLFSLLSADHKVTFANAIVAMTGKLDAGSRALAAQDFRHATQGPQETVSDYVLRLERIFRRAYGREHMTKETRKTLLHGQLQEGLKYVLMKAPAVSGARDYQEPCTAAKNEERRLSELNKRQQYLRDSATEDMPSGQHKRHNRLVQGKQPQGDGNLARLNSGKDPANRTNPRDPTMPSSTTTKRCYICDNVGHLAKH